MTVADRSGSRRSTLGPRGEDRRRGVLLAPGALKAFASGVETMGRALAVTLGPLGGTVVIDPILDNRSPEIVSDGGTVARRIIELPDRHVNAGAMLIRHLAWKMRQQAGDGSVTAAVLARAMTRSGVRMVSAGANPMLLRRGLDQAVQVVVDELANMAEPLSSLGATTAVARAVIGDDDLAGLVAEIFDIVGADGAIVVEEHLAPQSDREYLEGSRWDGGLVSSDFVAAQSPERTVLDNPLIAITTAKLTSASQAVGILQAAQQQGAESLAIIAPTIEGEALGTLFINHKKGRIPISPIKAPSVTDARPQILQDLAILTGGTVVNEEAGLSLERFHGQDFGRARRVIATRYDFTVVGAGGRPKGIRQRIAELRSEMAMLDQQEQAVAWDRLARRLANLSGGIAVLKVGTTSVGGDKLKRSLAEDAVRAVRSAIEEGTVPGGGSAYVACRPALRALATTVSSDEERAGIGVVAEGLSAPLQQIASNAGYPGSTIVARVESFGHGHVFDALSGTIAPSDTLGILDPVKVVRLALQLAGSTTAMLLTTEVSVLTKRWGAMRREDGRPTLHGVSTEP